MKTTIDLDEVKIEKLMRLTGLPTKKEAVDWALGEGVRMATLQSIKDNPLTPEEARNAVDPDYNIIALRNAQTPAKYKAVRKRTKVK